MVCLMRCDQQARHDKLMKAREDLSLEYEETPLSPKKVELPKMEVS